MIIRDDSAIVQDDMIGQEHDEPDLDKEGEYAPIAHPTTAPVPAPVAPKLAPTPHFYPYEEIWTRKPQWGAQIHIVDGIRHTAHLDLLVESLGFKLRALFRLVFPQNLLSALRCPMGDELGTDDAPFPAQAAGPLLVIIDENRRGLLLRRITEEGGFAFVSSAELAAAGDLRSAEAAREMAWEQLHLGPWDEVVPTWRDAYAMACLLVGGIRASAGDLKEALRVLDMGLIMGGPLLRRELEVAVGKISVMSASSQVECSGRSSRCGLENCRSWNIDEVLQILPSRSLACKAVEKQPSPSLEAFIRDYFLRSYPVIISNYIDHWPARTKWKDVDYLRSIAGDRTVPVEVGKNYLSSDWKQELITFSQFLDRIQTNTSSANLTYLAQHPLFDQIKELRNDIMIPDYCYAGGGELQSLNAWFGPPGTVTPLHYDPHHNIFAQVVGRKYVRLYPESASQDLYPHTESMLKNSSQVDLDNFDAKDFPRTADLDFIDCILEEGELLYIPPKWWHYLIYLTVLATVKRLMIVRIQR
ncbi:hypothetical protein IEQ34_006004 [Dendrobium chrysotoxum]|uniref:JmjC domain-containing protein n=1 Tax=Dendrobium chrysotoxum TaxID=161865 RepID=A0AAV7HA46_DENCH|nr:hypothetical protein IEQ34_006004 [Dendrobium chrysotoxum]